MLILWDILCIYTRVIAIHQNCKWCTMWISEQNPSRRLLYFQNVIQFHGTQVNVILFTLLRKVPTFPVLIFTKLTNPEKYYLLKLYAEFVPNGTINVEKMDTNSFRPPRKARLSLPPFSWILILLSTFLQTCTLQTFNQVRKGV